MPAKRTIKMANLNAGLYDGEFQACYDCVGEDRCKLAMFYTDPPSENEDCSNKHSGNCLHPQMARNALIALRDRITEELKQFEVDE